MKILKVKIKRKQTVGRTSYTYPNEYDPKKIRVLCYETSNPDNYKGVVDRGNDYEYCVGIVRDEDVDIFLDSDDIEEMDYNTALNTCDSWAKSSSRITDKDAVVSILDKIHNKKRLTKKEKKAIDPDDDTIGINRKNFKKMLDESLG